MSSFEYKTFYDQVGTMNGWNFSHVKCVSEGASWDLYSEVSKRCKTTDLLLDIGTGGGEAVLPIAQSALLLVGIDQSAGMIETAMNNAAKFGAPNVRFLQMDSESLAFPASFFDIVSCRHSEFHAHELARVLKNGGIFLTQQVSENDKLNLKEAFGRGQAWGEQAGTLKQKYEKELGEAGFKEIQSFELNTTEHYQTAEDLIFLLKYTPIIPNFGQSETDFQVLEQFIETNQTEMGIRTNSARFVMMARRS